MLLAPEKNNEKSSYKRLRIWNRVSDFETIKEFWSGTQPWTNSHLTDSWSTQRGLQQLPCNVSAADYSATPRRLLPITRNEQFINVRFTMKTNIKRQCRNTQTVSNRRLNARAKRIRTHGAQDGLEPDTHHRILTSVTTAPVAGRVFTTIAQILLTRYFWASSPWGA